MERTIKAMSATSKPEIYAKQILEHFELDGYFDFISGSLLSGERTDKAEVIAWAVNALSDMGMDCERNKMVMIGDREHDVIGAHKNQMPAIGVLFGYGSVEEFENAGAEAMAHTVEELRTMLAAV